jgi:hypothetical protein
MNSNAVLLEGIWGVKSAQGVITPAPSKEKAEEWAKYHFHTAIGDCGEVLFCLDGPEMEQAA